MKTCENNNYFCIYGFLGGPESSLTCAQGSRCLPDVLRCGLVPQTSPSHFLAELGGLLLSMPGGGRARA